MLKGMPREGRAPYQQQVPAVGRAVLALETLVGAAGPLSLASLSRALRVSPSSLLAILTTLRSAGLVERSDQDGTYTPGPGLVALGAAAGRGQRAVHRFQEVAERLVELTGESALLWLPDGDAWVLALAREGWQPLRFVPQLGLRLARADLDPRSPGPPVTGDPVAEQTGPPARRTPAGAAAPAPAPGRVVERMLLPGVGMLAVPLATERPGEAAILGVAGPAERLQGRAGAAARQALLAITQQAPAAPVAPVLSGSPPQPDASGPIGPAELDAFLGQGQVASLSYLSDDGYPASVPLWYAWDGTAFWLVPRPGAEWAEHVRRNPRVSLVVSESVPPLRRVLARGSLEAPTGIGSQQRRAIERQLAARYGGLGAPWPPVPRQPRPLLRLAPERLIAWRGLLPHPRASAEAQPTTQDQRSTA